MVERQARRALVGELVADEVASSYLDVWGNEKPIEMVSERWYAPELQAVVLSTHRDPRVGQDTRRLTGITRGEPDKSLFEVPAGYTVRQGPPPFLRGPGPGRPEEQQ